MPSTTVTSWGSAVPISPAAGWARHDVLPGRQGHAAPIPWRRSRASPRSCPPAMMRIVAPATGRGAQAGSGGIFSTGHVGPASGGDRQARPGRRRAAPARSDRRTRRPARPGEHERPDAPMGAHGPRDDLICGPVPVRSEMRCFGAPLTRLRAAQGGSEASCTRRPSSTTGASTPSPSTATAR